VKNGSLSGKHFKTKLPMTGLMQNRSEEYADVQPIISQIFASPQGEGRFSETFVTAHQAS
jgi:hypothetical protein